MRKRNEVLYVVSRWNQETETFIRREVAAVLDAGTSVQVLSLRRPRAPDGIVDEAKITVVHPTLAGFVAGFCAALVRRPRATAAGLWTILRWGRPGTWRAHLLAWASAVACWHRLDEPDAVLAHFAWVSATAADQLSRLHGAPFGVFPHAHDIYEHRCIDDYLGDRLRRAREVFVESERIADDVRRSFGVEAVVMRIGVPEEYVAATAKIISVSSPLVVSVGALREKKGHDLVIRAVAELPDVRLVIAGEGPERARLEALVGELGVDARAQLAGHVSLDAVRRLLDDADVFCLASRMTDSGDRDGVPNVLIEAMARGVPCISTRVSGIPDLLGGGCGILVEPDDVAGLASSMWSIFEEPRAAEQRAHLALERVRDDYTTARNVDRLLELLVPPISSVERPY